MFFNIQGTYDLKKTYRNHIGQQFDTSDLGKFHLAFYQYALQILHDFFMVHR